MTNIAVLVGVDPAAVRANLRIALANPAVRTEALAIGVPRVQTVPAELISTLMLAFSIVAVFALLLIVLGLISKVRNDRKKFDQVAPVVATKPFPQTVAYSTGVHYPQVAPELAAQTVREAYADWLAKLLLPDQEPGQAFIRMGVEKNMLRYQVSTTSFAQALGLLFTLVMAGDDLFAHHRFENLLAFALAHPAANQPDLTSWQSLPDVKPARRQDADPHAESWLALALLASAHQWRDPDRFKPLVILRHRLPALFQLYQQGRDQDPQPYQINAPAFFSFFSQVDQQHNWSALSSSLAGQSAELLTRDDLSLTGSGSAEESQLALQLLNYGLDTLQAGLASQKNLSGKLLQIARDCVLGFDQSTHAPLTMERQGEFSYLAQLACCAPVAMVYGDQALVDTLWQKLSVAEISKFDPMGISMRLLALMLLSGVMWPLSDTWQAASLSRHVE